MREMSYPMTPREQVVGVILEKALFEKKHECVAIEHCLGRVLAEDAHAMHTLPNKRTARLDGIACKYAHYSATNAILWHEGTDFSFCNTGTAIPDDCDTVIRIEDVEQLPTAECYRVTHGPARVGDLVCPPGSNMHVDDVLLPRGTLIDPECLGTLVSGGVKDVSVIAKPLIAFIPTGNELSPRGLVPGPGKNVESNGSMLGAYVSQWGGKLIEYPIQPDDPEALIAAVNSAAEACDMVILNAGSSKGERDYTLSALENTGEILVYKVDHGPGYHTTAAITPEGTPILGLVGPPGGAAVGARLYLKPLINAFLEQETPAPLIVRAELAEPFKVRQTIDFYQTVDLEWTNGKLLARRAKHMKGSACGIVKIPRGLDNGPLFQAGCMVDVMVDHPVVVQPLTATLYSEETI